MEVAMACVDDPPAKHGDTIAIAWPKLTWNKLRVPLDPKYAPMIASGRGGGCARGGDRIVVGTIRVPRRVAWPMRAVVEGRQQADELLIEFDEALPVVPEWVVKFEVAARDRRHTNDGTAGPDHRAVIFGAGVLNLHPCEGRAVIVDQPLLTYDDAGSPIATVP